jgi:hypothetical protein
MCLPLSVSTMLVNIYDSELGHHCIIVIAREVIAHD